MFLESAGRPDAIASDTEGAVGLTQILAETGQNLLGMQDRRPPPGPAATRAASAASCCAATCSRSRSSSAPARRSTSASIPRSRWQATARYLTMAKAALQARGDGVRQLPHGHGEPGGHARAYGGEDDVPCTQVYFDSSPKRHAAAYRSSPRSATTRRTTGGSSARPSGSWSTAARTRASWRPSRRRRRPRTRPRRCCTRPLDGALHDARAAAEGVGGRAVGGVPATSSA